MGPAYRIETERLVLRCFELADAPRLKAAIDASLATLAPWLAWARDEPQSIEAKLELVRQFRGKFDLGTELMYAILDAEEAEIIGGAALNASDAPDAREMGYWIVSRHAGRGYATEAVRALTRVAFEIERIDRVEIHCDPDNAKSRRIPEKLGFRHDGTLRRRAHSAEGRPCARMVWSMFADEYAESPLATARVETFDGLGRRIAALATEDRRQRRSAFR